MQIELIELMDAMQDDDDFVQAIKDSLALDNLDVWIEAAIRLQSRFEELRQLDSDADNDELEAEADKAYHDLATFVIYNRKALVQAVLGRDK